MKIKILDKKIKASEVKEFSKNWYETVLKGTVDLENQKVALGGEWHIESCEILVREGGKKTNIWGFNIVFGENKQENEFEFHSLVNIKPEISHKQMLISDEKILKEILPILENFIDLKN
jgi:hypothetical protein